MVGHGPGLGTGKHDGRNNKHHRLPQDFHDRTSIRKRLPDGDFIHFYGEFFK
jgi:hypothetical protein